MNSHTHTFSADRSVGMSVDTKILCIFKIVGNLLLLFLFICGIVCKFDGLYVSEGNRERKENSILSLICLFEFLWVGFVIFSLY